MSQLVVLGFFSTLLVAVGVVEREVRKFGSTQNRRWSGCGLSKTSVAFIMLYMQFSPPFWTLVDMDATPY